MKTVILALRMLRRDWRAGELRILVLAVAIAVSSVTSVGFFTNRVERALHQQANELLGADLVVVSDHTLDERWRRLVQARGLNEAETQIFLSMALAHNRNQLAEIKAVSAGYPLRGVLRIAPRLHGSDMAAPGVPALGTAWADPRLLSSLDLHPGDAMMLGDARLKVTAFITDEPDRGNAFFNVAPQLIMNLADVAATGLIQTGSRIQYRLLVAGPTVKIEALRTYLEHGLARGERLESVEDARPEMRTALTRAHQFLGLASLVSVVLAGVAIATATRRFVQRHLDHCAVLRCLGASQHDIVSLYAYQMIALGLVASLLGSAVGYFAQQLLADTLGSLVLHTLPPPSSGPLWVGLGVGVVSLFSFALPPLLQLWQVPTLRVLRKEMGALPPRAWLAYAAGGMSLALLMLWQVREVRLGLYMYAGTVVTVLALVAVAFGMLVLIDRLRGRLPLSWRFGLGQLTRRGRASVMQTVVFGIGIMALLLLSVVRVDLLSDWQNSLPSNAPNRFVINIQPGQVAAVKDFFRRAGHLVPDMYPMVRARLISINGHGVAPEDYSDEQAQRLVEREFNLSYAEQMQVGNSLTAGSWWSNKDDGHALLSLEEGIAGTLHIKLGDNLGYDVAGQHLEVKVANLRKVDWDNFQVNFFAILPPRVLDNYPISYITALYLPISDDAMLDRFVEHFPNATVIDVAAIIAKVRDIIQRVSQALEYVFVFTVLAGLMVLYAAIQATFDDRIRESAVLRTLGASRAQLVSGVLTEFGSLGWMAGITGALAASVVGYVLAGQVFHFAYHLNPYLWLVGMGGGTLGVAAAGFLGTRFILRRPPWQTLRSLEGDH